MRAVRLVLIAAAAIALLLAAGFAYFVAGGHWQRADTAPATDAIVVLTGGSGRLESGFALLREGKGKKLFVSGVNRRVDLAELLRASRIAAAGAACCVVLGHHADNTRQNAVETARWMRQEGYKSLRLVTAWYHMPRSLLEFARAMPDIEILPHPVFPEEFKPARWWSERGNALLVLREYGKYLATLFRPLVPETGRAARGRDAAGSSATDRAEAGPSQ
ncbi:MAG TPA: YdcF family protein [Stellaceae bacterium]|nr:YdcF family protein [Stellaceae bacterium]